MSTASKSVLAHCLDRQRTSDVRLKETAPFNKMLLKTCVLKGLNDAGFVTPTVIQSTAIPVGKSGLDLLVQAKSGTGKTVIFGTIVLEAYRSEIPAPQALIISPTRELAIQICDVLNMIGRFCDGFHAVHVIGGVAIGEDRKRMSRASAVVGTPGRLFHLLDCKILNTSHIRVVVLDEADQLYSGTLRNSIMNIQRKLGTGRQIIACSATFQNGLDKELVKIMRSPLLISTENRATLLVGIKQFAYELPEERTSVLEMQSKLDGLRNIFVSVAFKQCIIFAGSQSRADSYRNYLEKDGWPCDLISGAQDQQTRMEIFRKFRECQTRILVATDLMARGIDSEYTNLVINVEVPGDLVTYLHRIGRAGRFGSHGLAISFVASAKERASFHRLIMEGGAGMNVLKFPPKVPADYNFWDFSQPAVECKRLGAFGIALAPLVAAEQVSSSHSDSQDDKENQTDNVANSFSSIDTKTFRIDSKDSAVNVLSALDIRPAETKAGKLPLVSPQPAPPPPPTQLTSDSRLPSSNTIDDASSIAADSLRSSQQEISDAPPVLVQKATLVDYLVDKLTERASPMQSVDLFEDYRNAMLKSDSEQQAKNNMRPPDSAGQPQPSPAPPPPSTQLTADSRLPSSNTIDDASSFAADSLRSSQQDISPSQPMLAQKQPSTIPDDKSNESVAVKPQLSQEKLASIKALLIDSPTPSSSSADHKQAHLYSDYTNYKANDDDANDNDDEDDDDDDATTVSISQATSIDATATATEEIDKATFVLSVATPANAPESLEEMQNSSSLELREIGGKSHVANVPERPHHPSPAYNAAAADSLNFHMPKQMPPQQQRKATLSIDMNAIMPLAQDDDEKISSAGESAAELRSNSGDESASRTETEPGASSGFNENSSTESSGIETSEAISDGDYDDTETGSSFDESADCDLEEEDDGDVDDEATLHGTAEYAETDDDDSAMPSAIAGPAPSADANTVTPPTTGTQSDYEHWLDVYRQQVAHIQDYVKLTARMRQQQQQRKAAQR